MNSKHHFTVRWAGPRRVGQAAHRPGQALVELALMIVFIAMLLAAAIDLGLAFKTHQMLTNAAAEATSFLAQQPLVPCSSSCDLTALKANADNAARTHFRNEIGDDAAVARLRDLDGNGQDDGAQNLSYQSGWMQIDAADSSMFDASNPTAFKIGGFNPANTDQACQDRKSTWLGGQCYIVVRTQIVYKPFFPLAPFFLSTLANGSKGFIIHAYAIKPIVGTP